MAAFQDLTTAQLRQILHLREQIDVLQEKLDTLLGGTPLAKSKSSRSTGKRTMSAATKKKMRAAQQARWAKLKGESAPAKAPIKMVAKKKGGLTAAGRAKLAAAMRARWAAKKGASASV